MTKFYNRSTNPPNVPPGVMSRTPMNNNARGEAPIAFSANAQLQYTTAPNAILNTETLQPGFRAPYWIDEIHIGLDCVTVKTGGRSATNSGMSAYVKAKFETGNFAFSKDAQPVGIYAPVWGSQAPFAVNFLGIDVGNAASATEYYFYNYIRWPLPRPLYMPAGDVIQCRVELDPSFTSQVSANNQIGFLLGYTGRMAAPGTPAPLVRHVPWVSHFREKFVSADTYAREYHTTDEFRNPFTKTLNIQRLTSRTYLDSNLLGSVQEQRDLYQYQYTGASHIGIKIDDSQGYVIAKNAIGDAYVPLLEMFGAQKAWTFNRTLGAKEQLNVGLACRGSNVTGTWYDYDATTIIGMIGYREESP